MERLKRNKPVLIISVVLLSVLVVYAVFLLLLNRTTTAEVDLAALGKRETPLIAYDTPQRRNNVRKVSSLPNKGGSTWEMDLRSLDLSGLDLTDKLNGLSRVTFNNLTVWPEKLPEGFSPDLIMDLGKNPGLGIRELHEQGITGKGVGIAIIDQGLLAGHEQYEDNLRLYEMNHCIDKKATMHGAAVSSAAVGKDTGVAPGSDLYFIGNTFGQFFWPFTFRVDFNYLAESIYRILEINRYLPEDGKIRVISISRGFNEYENGGKAFKDAIDRANDEGVFVITTSPDVNFDFILRGLDRNPIADPDDYKSYLPGSWWAAGFYANYGRIVYNNMLLVPMDSRTFANCTGTEAYSFYSEGGLSWSVPWLAGMYALCIQVKPDITPEIFIRLAYETGDTLEIEKDGKIYRLEKIINPLKLIEVLKREV